MGKVEITDKLNDFLKIHLPMTEECHAVYLMVEVRKLLEHDKKKLSKTFPTIQFYCDWTLHTQKDAITPEMKLITKKIYNRIKQTIENPTTQKSGGPVRDFLYMEELKNEFKNLFQQLGINAALTDVKDNWTSFVLGLISILNDQPIRNPIPEVPKVCFMPAAPRCAHLYVKFASPINGHDHYDGRNVYV